MLRALLIAGAAGRVMELTVSCANGRTQFGKPIGPRQAVQQQLAARLSSDQAGGNCGKARFGDGSGGGT